MTFTLGSFCTGYGGIELGLALAGVQFVTAFHAEKEADPALVLKAEHPETPNVGDITDADWRSMPGIHLLVSGDPCQSISIAGRREGRVDPRFLWPDVRRGYRELAPHAIFFENVANMTSHDGGHTMRERFAHLQADGYGVRYVVVGACAVGAPHHRHRWFALASRDFKGVTRVGGEKQICGAPRSGGRILLPTPRATDVGTQGRRSSDGWRPQLGQAVIETWGKFAEAVALWEQITGIPAPAPTVPGARGGVRLNPELPEWMMGLRPGLLTGVLDRNAALKAAGNGVVPRQAAAAWSMLNEYGTDNGGANQ